MLNPFKEFLVLKIHLSNFLLSYITLLNSSIFGPISTLSFLRSFISLSSSNVFYFSNPYYFI